MESISNNKRIARNTILLYGRMLLLLVISLYTSRVILKALGVVDYGIYNVVGGVVSLFSILTGSLSSAISRYITFELGKGDVEKLKLVFCTSINVLIGLVIVLIILFETIGLWFLNNKMVIPVDRIDAANYIYHISVLTFIVNLWSVPYNACIIAHERMSAFAYVSIFDAAVKLIVAFIIVFNPFDRLVYYAILMFLAGLIQRYLYASYCKKRFDECKYKLVFDWTITKEMFAFAGWNFIGASSAVLREQGGSVIINLFFGPGVNAARGIATSVNAAIIGFVNNFMVALNPQITKSYANGEKEYMLKLAFKGAKFSFFIMLSLSIPVIFTTPYLLELWLNLVPDHTVNFVRLILLFALSETLAAPLVTIMLATGNIRNYQLIVGGFQLLNLPISYMFLRLGFPSEIVYLVAIGLSVICEFARLIMLRKMVQLSMSKFLKEVYGKSILVWMIAMIVPFLICSNMIVDNFLSFGIVVSFSIISSFISIYFVGCNDEERKLIVKYTNKLLKRLYDKN